MSIGNSGRIVIEIEPDAKRLLYSALARDGLTLKEWFMRNANIYLTEGAQLPLSFLQSRPEVGPEDIIDVEKKSVSRVKL